MYHSAAAIFGLSALSSFVVAQNGIAFTSFPSECSVGETCVFEYSAEGPVTIVLRRGESTNLETVETLSTDSTGGVFEWTPAVDPGNDYALEIRQGDQNNYSGLISVTGDGPVPDDDDDDDDDDDATMTDMVTETDTVVATETDVDTETETVTDFDTDTETVTDVDTATEVETETETELVTSTETEIEETVTETETVETETETETEVETEIETEVETETETAEGVQATGDNAAGRVGASSALAVAAFVAVAYLA